MLQTPLAMNNITQEEIKKVESILLPEGETFGDNNSERVKIIKDIEDSCHIVACPGSGKTTVLLAKLLILAERMPFDNNQGICVLTHTNVAIDEIKEKAGAAGDKLFKYPNFFGTIQSFVDTYLARPALAKYYNSVPAVIDTETGNKKLVSLFKVLPFNSKLNGKLWGEFFENEASLRKKYIQEFFKLSNVEINEFITQYIDLGILRKKKSKYILDSNKTKIKNGVENARHKSLFIEIRKYIEEEIEYKKILKIKSYTLDFIGGKIHDEFDKYFCFSSKSGTDFLKLKETLFKQGVLTYRDTFDIGNRYINDYSELKKLFYNRFKYVFVDEMQDTDIHQLKIIESLFKDTNTIVQYFGDPNQAIFDNAVKEISVWKVPAKGAANRYDISDSKRYGEPISNILNKFKIVQDIDLSGNGKDHTLKPILISFEEDHKLEVLKKFAEIINRYHEGWKKELAKKNKKPIYKAIGWVSSLKEKEERLTIPSYFPDFEKKSDKHKQSYRNLKYYLRKNPKPEDKSAKYYFNNILNALLECLFITETKNGNRYYSKHSLLNKLDDKDENNLRRKIAQWSRKIRNTTEVEYNEEVVEEVRKYIQTTFAPKFEFQTKINTIKFKNFIEKATTDIPEDVITTKKHIYVYSENPEIQIEVGTVHSVKGETHTATLYLETFFRKHEIDKIKDNFQNEPVDDSNSNVLKTIKMLHVGFSRPTNLLCYAVSKSRFNDELEGFDKEDI